jgi:hypothetical protein
MVARCEDQNSPAYHNYGGRGIKIHPSMRSFDGFFAVMGERPSRLYSLDRWPDNNGDYAPGNVRWATKIEQHRNQRSNRMITHNGETLPLCVWGERLGLKPITISARLKNGWTLEEAMTSEKFPPGPGKLTADQAREIFAAAGTHKDIATRFGIHQTIVSRIKSGKRWVAATAALASGGSCPTT